MLGTAGGSLQDGRCLVAGATCAPEDMYCLVTAACLCQAACIRQQVQEGLGDSEPLFGNQPDGMRLPGACSSKGGMP